MGGIRPSVLALIITLSVATSGVAAVQTTDGNLVESSSQIAQDVEASFSGESQTKTEQTGLSAKSTSATLQIDPVNECDNNGDSTLIAKYNWDTEKDEFVFEKGYAGDSFEFTIPEEYMTDDGPLYFEWSSKEPNSDRKIRPDSKPRVKLAAGKINGPDTDDYLESFDPPTTSDDVKESDKKAYSQIQFCGGDFYQVDFVSGTTVFDPLDDTTYSSQNRLLQATIGDTAGNQVVQTERHHNVDGWNCVEVADPITIDPSTNTTSIKIKAKDKSECNGEKFTLVSYDLPDGATFFATPQEVSDQMTIEIGEDISRGETKTFTVDLSDRQ